MGGVTSLVGEPVDDGIVSIASKTTTDSNFNIKDLIFPNNGITLSFLDHFIEECGGLATISRDTTFHVCMKYIDPITRHTQLPYCDLLSKNYPQYVRPAQVYVSFPWDAPFLDVVNALQTKFNNNPNISLWMDVFCNNLHIETLMRGEQWVGTWLTVLKDGIGAIGYTVVILYPWDKALSLRRAW